MGTMHLFLKIVMLQTIMKAGFISVTKWNLLELWGHKQLKTQMSVFPDPMSLVYCHHQALSSPAQCCGSFFHFSPLEIAVPWLPYFPIQCGSNTLI
jgi:hypothetical protein